MNITNEKFLVFLHHSNHEFQSKLRDLLLKYFPNMNVRTFENIVDGLNDPELIEADLLITDLPSYSQETFITSYQYLKSINFFVRQIPLLLVINNSYSNENRIPLNKEFEDLIYDFIDSDNFYEYIFLNRVKVLLGIPKLSKDIKSQEEKLGINIWKILNISNLFIIATDKEMNIKLINKRLTRRLGYNHEAEILGKPIINFIQKKELFKYIHNEITNGSDKHRECSFEMIDIDKNPINIKWFNALINSQFNLVFSIGISLAKTEEPTMDADIDSIRSYFREILEKDKIAINAMKEVTLKYSKKILSCSNNTI